MTQIKTQPNSQPERDTAMRPLAVGGPSAPTGQVKIEDQCMAKDHHFVPQSDLKLMLNELQKARAVSGKAHAGKAFADLSNTEQDERVRAVSAEVKRVSEQPKQGLRSVYQIRLRIACLDLLEHLLESGEINCELFAYCLTKHSDVLLSTEDTIFRWHYLTTRERAWWIFVQEDFALHHPYRADPFDEILKRMQPQ